MAKRRAKKKPEDTATLLVRRPVLAKVLGVSLRQVGALEAELVLKPSLRGKAGRASLYNLAEAVPAYIAHVTAAKPTAPREGYWQAKTAREQLELQRESGKLVSRDQVILEGQAYTKAWAAQVRNLAPRLEQLGLISREHLPGVQALLRELLTEIANWRTMADLAAAAGDPS